MRSSASRAAGLRVGDVLSRLFDKPLGVLFTSSYREAGGTTQSSLLIAEHLSSAGAAARAAAGCWRTIWSIPAPRWSR